MNNATLGLELEYDFPKVTLGSEGQAIKEEDFKSKHMTIIEGDEEVKSLFSSLGEYGVKVTLDTKSGHEILTHQTPLTLELVLDHDKFEIDNSRCIKDKEILLSKGFAEQVDEFTKFIMKNDRAQSFNIKFDGNDTIYSLNIPLYTGNIKLMPHVTIPCPLYRVGNPERNPPYEWEDKKNDYTPDYALIYLSKILDSLKALTKNESPLSEEEHKIIEKHDPKQSYPTIPKTSLKEIFKKIKLAPNCKLDNYITTETTDYYITPNITYNELIEDITTSTSEQDLLKDNLIGIGSIGNKFEKIWNEECPIFEFRSVGSFDAKKIHQFERKIKEELLHLYIGNRTPFSFNISL